MSTYDKQAIARYITGDMDPEELANFRQELARNPMLAEQVEAYEASVGILRERIPGELEGARLRETLEEMNKEHFSSKARVIPIPRYILAGAAAAAIIAVIFLWPSPGYIDRWGQMKMLSSLERGSGTDSLLHAASLHFNNAEYDKALPLLDKAVMIDSTSQMALYYRGVCLFFTGHVQEARTDLRKVYNGSSVFRYEAAFFIALGYADEKNIEKTREWVKKIPPGTPVSEKAGELKEAIDELEKK